MFVICLQRDFYTLAELQKVPPPQGVDPAKLEAYLSDSTFQVSLAVCKFVLCLDGLAIGTTHSKVQYLYHQPRVIEYSIAYHFTFFLRCPLLQILEESFLTFFVLKSHTWKKGLSKKIPELFSFCFLTVTFIVNCSSY